MSRRVRDFHAQSWSNPFYAKRAGASRFRLWALSCAALVLLGGAAYLLIYSPFLRIKDISVGAQTISSEDIRNAVSAEVAGYAYLILPKDQLWFVDTEDIRRVLRERFVGAKDFSVRKKRGWIYVVTEEYEPTFRLIIGEKSYLLDQEGIGMREAALGEGDALIALSDETAVFSAGGNLLPDAWPQAIIDIHKYFATLIGVRDRLIGLQPTDNSVQVMTNEDWYVIMDPSADIPAQLKSLSAALIGKFDAAARQRLEYVDVRFGDRIFYKWR